MELNTQRKKEALEILNNAIAKLTLEFSTEKDEQKSNLLKSKIETLEEYQNHILKGNSEAIKTIINEYKKGKVYWR